MSPCIENLHLSQDPPALLSVAGTSSDGYPLTDLSALLRQSLHKSIVALYEMLHPDAVHLLLKTHVSFWKVIDTAWLQEEHRLMKGSILRFSFTLSPHRA